VRLLNALLVFLGLYLVALWTAKYTNYTPNQPQVVPEIGTKNLRNHCTYKVWKSWSDYCHWNVTTIAQRPS
jgi:hypothetical protein